MTTKIDAKVNAKVNANEKTNETRQIKQTVIQYEL
jgi:hypothetical protein